VVGQVGGLPPAGVTKSGEDPRVQLSPPGRASCSSTASRISVWTNR
jgi:hypothetical protein